MNNWIYKDKIFDEQPGKDRLGFVYYIEHIETGKYYIGKKQFWKAIRRKPLKGQKRVRKDIVASDWKTYWGSSKPFTEYIKTEGEDKFIRTILSIHEHKSGLSYEELIQQIKHDVLRDSQSYNGIINVRLSRII